MPKINKNWQDSITRKPQVGERVLVKMMCNDNIYFSVYTGEDEFDVHRPELIYSIKSSNHRDCWFKFSHRSVAWWRYF